LSMGLQARCGRGRWRSEVVIVATVSSKEFLGTLGTRFACGKLAKNSWRLAPEGCSSLRFRVASYYTFYLDAPPAMLTLKTESREMVMALVNGVRGRNTIMRSVVTYRPPASM
jgi:hypothetical protein